MGGGGVWKPLPGAALAPMPEATSVGRLPALNLLFDPCAISGRRNTRCYYSTRPSWAGSSSGGKARPSCSGSTGAVSWVKHWRQGKAVVFRVDWGTVLALPRPIYDPGCHSSYEGLIPNSRTAKAASVAANVAKPAAQSAPTASVGAPIEAPTAASHFRDAMGAVQGARTSATFEVWCLFVSLNF